MDIYSLTPHYFEWAVKHMADMAIKLAKNPRPQAVELRWDGFFRGRRQDGPAATLAEAASAGAPAPPTQAATLAEIPIAELSGTGAPPSGPLADAVPPVVTAPPAKATRTRAPRTKKPAASKARGTE
jgi:hypothetical protein